MNNTSKTTIFSLLFLLLFIAPHTIVSIMPKSSIDTYYLLLFIAYFVYGIFFYNSLLKKKYLISFIFSSSFIVFGVINLLYHHSDNYFNILAPIISHIAYVSISEKKIDTKVFDVFLIFLYTYFFFAYFLKLPNLIYRYGFDESVFENSSSNAIPIALNVTLYAYIIYEKIYNKTRSKKILAYSIINLVLIIIQQSRAGIIVSIVIFLLALFNYNQEKKIKLIIYSFLLIVPIWIFFSDEINNYLELVGKLQGISDLKMEARSETFFSFFENFNIDSFIFGHSNRTYGTGEFLYTYNLFLDMWNKYGIIQLFIFFVFFIYRFSNKKKYFFNFYFFIPFFSYSFVEPRFFPGFWDVIIYTILFTSKSHKPIHNRIIDN